MMSGTNKKGLIIPVYVNHAGCPMRCSFCNQDRIAGEGSGIPNSETVSSLITDYLESWQGYGCREVAFYGGSFTAIDRDIQESLLQSVQPFLKSGEIDAVRLSTRPDAIDEETLDFLRPYGVETIELGIQSMDDAVLAAAGRNYGAERALKAARLVKEGGFRLGCQMMPGLPLDSPEKSLRGVEQIAELKPDFARIYPALVIKGTELERFYREGNYSPLALQDAVSLSADMVETFEQAGTEMIRVGLQPTVELEASVVAGPYHPAFGALVESELFLRKTTRVLREKSGGMERVSLTLSPRDESAFRGMGNGNMQKLKMLFPELHLHLIKEAGLPRGSLRVN